jgi:prevent-host-death family protein
MYLANIVAMGTRKPSYNVHEAKTQLSRLLARVESGEEVIIARDGVPVARLIPARPPADSRRLGTERGRVFVSDDFDAPLSGDDLAAFEE